MECGTNIFIILAGLVVSHCLTVRGVVLDCTYGMGSHVVVGSIYRCDGIVIFDGSVDYNLTAVYGMHESGKSHEDVRGLVILSQSLEGFPTNIENFFPNLVLIDFTWNNISSISNQHINHFPNLQVLWLNINQVTSLDGDLLSGLDSIQLVHFGSNSIRHVGHDLNLPINGTTYFNSNPCIDQYAYTPDTVADLKLNLLRSCPPTISQIEDSLAKRENLLTHVNGEVQRLRNEQANLIERIERLERLIENPNSLDGANAVGKFLIDTSRRND